MHWFYLEEFLWTVFLTASPHPLSPPPISALFKRVIIVARTTICLYMTVNQRNSHVILVSMLVNGSIYICKWQVMAIARQVF